MKLINALTKEIDTVTDAIKTMEAEQESHAAANLEMDDERSHILAYVNQQWKNTKKEMEVS